MMLAVRLLLDVYTKAMSSDYTHAIPSLCFHTPPDGTSTHGACLDQSWAMTCRHQRLLSEDSREPRCDGHHSS